MGEKRRLRYDTKDGFIMSYEHKPDTIMGDFLGTAILVYDVDKDRDPGDSRIDLVSRKMTKMYTASATVNLGVLTVNTDCKGDMDIECLSTPPVMPDPLPENPTPEQKEAWKLAMIQWEKDMIIWEKGMKTVKMTPTLGQFSASFSALPEEYHVKVKHRLCKDKPVIIDKKVKPTLTGI